MRNKLSSVLWGLAFIGVGVVFLGNVLHWWNISLFFEGWWTLFIIIPCLISMIQSGVNTGNVIGVLVGVALLLAANDIIGWSVIWPVVLIGVGISIIFPSFFSKRPPKNISYSTGNQKNYSAVFSGSNIRVDHEVFDGCTINTTFGGIELDLRDAIIDKDIVIRANCIFGGADIFLPSNVKVQIGGTHIFGGVDSKFRNSTVEGAPLVFVDATCIFGGLDVK